MTTDKPCAAPGLTSYRYKGTWGWIMIGAKSHSDALNEASRSLTREPAIKARLQVWSDADKKYVWAY